MTNAAAAIYARFSTDRQRETSLDDQARVCQARADLLGISVSTLYRDDGISGSTPVGARPGGARLLADALAGRVQVLFLEGLDRLSRDQVEQERTVRRLEHRGIRIIGVADGYDSEAAGRKIHRTMRGLINEIYLDDLRHKTHRGLAGQLARGGHAGGLSYGYRSVAAGDIHRLEVEPEQAELVRWIYTRYAEGWSCQRIASDLNARGVRTGRGGTWAVSALYGSPAKGSGLLNNELYVGRVIWNRSQWVKDPDSGKRTRMERPRDEWHVEERPELRIISDELWNAVRVRQGRPTMEGGSAGKGTRPRSLFGGLLRCGCCGGAVIATSGRHYGCAARKDRGPAVCAGVTAHRAKVDTRLLATIREDLLSPEAIAELQATVKDLLATRRCDAATQARAAKARMAEVDAEIHRLVDAIAAIGISPALQTRLAQAESERAGLELEQYGQHDHAAAALIDGIQRYRKLLSDLETTLATDPQRAREILRGMIAPATMIARDGQVWVEMETGRAAIAVGLSLGLVAGAGFEPATFGL
jgi:site-specific DNA recombinase